MKIKRKVLVNDEIIYCEYESYHIDDFGKKYDTSFIEIIDIKKEIIIKADRTIQDNKLHITYKHISRNEIEALYLSDSILEKVSVSEIGFEFHDILTWVIRNRIMIKDIKKNEKYCNGNK